MDKVWLIPSTGRGPLILNSIHMYKVRAVPSGEPPSYHNGAWIDPTFSSRRGDNAEQKITNKMEPK